MNSLYSPNLFNPSPPLTVPQRKSVQLAHQLLDSTTMATQFSRRFEQLLLSEKHSDCVFHIDGAQLKCHKLILATASPVFEAMFYGPLREQQPEIEILDISADIFRMLLLFIYAGIADFETLNLDEAIELYYCAEKYLVADLSQSCLLAIARKLRYNNILPALELCICMDLRDLLEVCMSFFSRCCLNNPQYMTAHRKHYVHISKDCIKAIIAANKSEKTSKQVLWFVYEWCQQECRELGLEQKDCALIISDLQLTVGGRREAEAAEGAAGIEENRQQQHQQQQQPNKQQCTTIERSYFKACRPFTVDHDTHEWTTFIKCDRFIALRGLIVSSRLTPNLPPFASAYCALHAASSAIEYSENICIEILAPAVASANENRRRHHHDRRWRQQRIIQLHSSNNSVSDNDDIDYDYANDTNDDSDAERNDDAVAAETIIWQHRVAQKSTRFNCDMNIDWGEDLLLSPDFEYKIKLLWHKDAYGSEYPCSLQSDHVDGIRFRDMPMQCGSLVKGLRFTNLI